MKARGPGRAIGGTSPARRLAPPIACALLAALAASPTHRAFASLRPAPLTNEDVVRMVMTGVPQSEVLATIEARDVDFDLSTEMIQELRVAGVPDRVLEAMRRRQAAMPRADPPPLPRPAPERTGTLRLEFAPGEEDDKPSELSAIALKKLPKGLERRGGEEVGEMSDMALAVLCTTADHVPDHWDTRSPLQGAPRHELLQFIPGSGTAKVKGHEVLYLDRKEAYDLEVGAGSHNIVVAAAGKQAGSGTWRLLESDGARVTVIPGRRTRVVLRARSRIKGSFMMGFTVDSEWRIVSVDLPDAAASPEARP